MSNLYPGTDGIKYDYRSMREFTTRMNMGRMTPATGLSVGFCLDEFKKKFSGDDIDYDSIILLEWYDSRYDEFIEQFKIGKDGNVNVDKMVKMRSFNGGHYYMHKKFPIMYVENDALADKLDSANFKGVIFLID